MASKSFFQYGHTFGTRLLLAALAFGYGGSAHALPTGPQIVNGTAAFAQTGNTLLINNSNNAILNWQQFSIGAGEAVRFNQPSASSSVLNRVLGADPSAIYGQLSSNGRVWLINPAGILVGPGARIDTAGFVASTLNLRNEDFLAGRLTFGGNNNAGRIANQGTITTPDGGSVYLVAANVSNEGLITTPKGETILAAGQSVKLIDTATPGVNVEITGAAGNATNLGSIVAAAGRIGVAGVLVRNSGTLNASSVVNQGGRIFLKASKDTYVDQDAHIDSNGTKGGSIEVLGNRVALTDRAQLDASGQNGGGTVLVGGDYQGKNPGMKNAAVTYFGPQVNIKVDAITEGDGGKAIVWADDATRAYGSISARGGLQSGNGGLVETSGKRFLDFQSQVDTRSPHGQAGNLLLDPSSIYIATNQTNATNAGMSGTDTTADQVASSILAGGTAPDSLLTVSNLLAALSSTNVTVSTTNAIAAGNGDIVVVDPVAWSSANKLTLSADRNVSINANVTGSNGDLSLKSTSTGTVTVASGKVASGSAVELASVGGAITVSGTVTGSISATVHAGTGTVNTGTTGSITAPAITLQNDPTTVGGAIGTSGTPLRTSSPGGSGNANITIGVSAYGPSAAYLKHGGDATLLAMNLQGSAPIDIAATNNLTPTSITTTGDLSLTAGNLLNIPTLTNLTAANINLVGNLIDIYTGANPASINTGSGLLRLYPTTASRPIDLGAKAGLPNTLELSTAELNRLTGTGTLRIGSTTAGNLSLSAALAPTGGYNTTGTLSLFSGGTITQAASATITSNKLAIKALGDVSLGTESNMVVNLAASIGDASNLNKNLLFKNGQSLTVGSNIDSLTGIVNNNFDNSSSGGIVSLTTTAGSLTQAASATFGVKGVNAVGYAGVSLTESNGTGVISGSTTSGDFIYRSSNQVNVSQVNGISGITVPGANNVKLESSSASGITQQSGKTINTNGGGLVLVSANGPVTLPEANNIGSLAADVGSTMATNSNGLLINSTQAMSVNNTTAMNGVTGVNAYNTLARLASSTSLSVTRGVIGSAPTIKANKLDLSAPTLSLTGYSSTDQAVEVTDGLALVTNSLTTTNLAAKATAASGIIYITPYTSGYSIKLGATGTCSSCLTLSASIASITTLNAQIIAIGNNWASWPFDYSGTRPVSSSISITDPFNLTTSRDLLFATSGGITQTSGSIITANKLGIRAGDNVDLTTAANSVTSLTAKDTGTGKYFKFKNDTAALTISGFSIPFSTASISGTYTMSGISASGDISLQTGGLITINQPIQTTAGNLILGTTSNITSSYSGTALSANGTANLVAGWDGSSSLTSPTVVASTGNITLTNAKIHSGGAMTVSAGNTIGVTASAALAGFDSSGNQSIKAKTITLTASSTGGVTDHDRYASLSSSGTQTISAESLTINGGGATDSYNNYAAIYQGSASGSQTITIANAGSLYLYGGNGTGTGGYYPSACTVCVSTPQSSHNVAEIVNKGSGGQTIDFLAGGTISLTGGTLGKDNYASINNASSSLQKVGSTNGSAYYPSIALTGGASGGSWSSDHAGLRNSAEIATGDSGSQNIRASSITLSGYGDTGTVGGATISGGSSQDISTTGNITLTGGYSNVATPGETYNVATAAGIGGKSTISMTLNVGGNLHLTGGTGSSAPALIGSLNGVATGTVTVTGTSTTTAATSTALINVTEPTTTAISTTTTTTLAPTITQCVTTPTLPGCTAILPTLDTCTANPTAAGCSAVLPSISTCTTSPTAAGCSAVLPPLATCTANPTAAGCSAVLPPLATCTATPTAAGCSAVLPPLDTCTTNPSTAGCTAVLPPLATCTANPTAAGCSAVLPPLATCTANPTAAGCSAVLPPLATCTATPTAAGCSAVLPPLDTCTTNPSTAGCTAVLPPLATCTTNPTAPGCSAVLPPLATCTANPTAAGCSVVLPPLATCTTTPTAPGCSAVLPTLNTCTTTPTAAGCSAVLPPLATCTANPTAAGCSAVLPSISTCTTTPTAAGCSAVLPPLATCTTNPTAAGCSAVLPSISTCTTTPTAAGCSAVLPALATCTTNPTAAGCSAVLPSISTCTTTPTAAGCSAVLPALATCTTNPTAAGCSAVLPTLDTCTATPTAAGCSAVLPAIATCTTTPTAAGCSAVLPTLSTCTATPTAAGCSAVLPPIANCTTNPTLAGCSAVLPSVASCSTDPSLPGCVAVIPPAAPVAQTAVAKEVIAVTTTVSKPASEAAAAPPPPPPPAPVVTTTSTTSLALLKTNQTIGGSEGTFGGSSTPVIATSQTTTSLGSSGTSSTAQGTSSGFGSSGATGSSASATNTSSASRTGGGSSSSTTSTAGGASGSSESSSSAASSSGTASGSGEADKPAESKPADKAASEDKKEEKKEEKKDDKKEDKKEDAAKKSDDKPASKKPAVCS